MKKVFANYLFPAVMLVMLSLGSRFDATAQNMIPLPPQSTTYSGWVRGMWFIAPVGFTITGLRIPASAGSGSQNIQVLKIGSGGVSVYPSNGTNFTTLFYVNSAPNNTIIPVNISVNAGDTIGILGQAGSTTSYSASASPFPTTIGGFPTELNRLLYQGSIATTQAPVYSSEVGYNIGRIEVYYMVAPPDNAGIDSLVNPTSDGNFCSGLQDVIVRLSNLGSNTLQSVDIEWSIDGVLQAPVSYTGPLDSIMSANHSEFVNLGSAIFPYNVPVEIKAWTTMPNGVADNDPSDDTLTQTVVAQKQGIELSIIPQDTTICEGASLTLNAGAHPSNPIYVWSTGALTRTINVTTGGDYWVKVMNATGCEAIDTVRVSVNPAPSATNISVIALGGGTFEFDVVGPTNVATYTWNFGDGSPVETGSGPKMHHYDQQGVYGVTLTLGNDCGSNVKSKQVNVDQVGIANHNQSAIRVTLYPNPANGRVYLQSGPEVTLFHLSIFNQLGQRVYTADINDPGAGIDLSGLAAGLYQVLIQTDKGKVLRKLSVQ